jgi:Ca-activated chloride channel homolog
MSNVEFANPENFYLMILLVPAIIWYIFFHNRYQAEMHVSTIAPLVKSGKKGFRVHLRHVPFILRLLALAALIVILARPQSTNRWNSESVEGIDIMLALDISGSMLAMDFSPNRIEASKNVATEFVAGRPNDRIGLVLFGGESFTQCPLTTDHALLMNMIKDVKIGIIDDQSTAIGLGLANAVRRLKDSDAINRVIILVTDGVNNAGSIDPLTAAEIASAFGVRIYTIGVGTRGMAPMPYRDAYGSIRYQQQEVDIDEDMLGRISSLTNGQYFRAVDNEALKEVYAKIDQLEKSRIDVRQYSKKYEQFRIFGIWALIFLLTEFVIRNLFLRSIV